MEKRPIIPPVSRRIGYAIATLVLVAIGAALTGGVFFAQSLAESSPSGDGLVYSRLAWASLAGLAVVLVLLVWVMVRWLSAGLQARTDLREQGPHVDVWKLSGERMEVRDDEEEGESPDHGEPNEPGR